MGDTLPATRARIESVDLLRGVIMIVMALDHTRDFFGMLGANPTNLATTTTALFFTRWVTYFVWRPVAKEGTEYRAVQRAVVPQYDQVSALIALPSDDARAGDDLSSIR